MFYLLYAATNGTLLVDCLHVYELLAFERVQFQTFFLLF